LRNLHLIEQQEWQPRTPKEHFDCVEPPLRHAVILILKKNQASAAVAFTYSLAKNKAEEVVSAIEKAGERSGHQRRMLRPLGGRGTTSRRHRRSKISPASQSAPRKLKEMTYDSSVA
jgi:hypothetical protein